MAHLGACVVVAVGWDEEQIGVDLLPLEQVKQSS